MLTETTLCSTVLRVERTEAILWPVWYAIPRTTSMEPPREGALAGTATLGAESSSSWIVPTTKPCCTTSLAGRRVIFPGGGCLQIQRVPLTAKHLGKFSG